MDYKKGKVDHPPHGSKDIADALAGVVYGLTMRRDVWNSHNVTPLGNHMLMDQMTKEDGRASAIANSVESNVPLIGRRASAVQDGH
jgi:hypothetical protein